MSNKILPFEITVAILSYLLKRNPGTYVVFCQMNVISPLESFEYNTFSYALEKYINCTSRRGSSAIYERHNNIFKWLHPYFNSDFRQFIENIHNFLGI